MVLESQMQLESEYVMRTFARKQVAFVDGKGMELFDDRGNRYLDFVSGIGVVSLGHCHPALVEALSAQAARLMHVSNYYYIQNRGEVAQRLSLLLNEGQDEHAPVWRTFFANSGAEANECAIKLARLHGNARSRSGGNSAPLIVTLEGGFHGRTLASLAATAQPVKQRLFQPLPEGFVSTPINDVAALEQLFQREGARICGMIVECVQGEGGVHPCSAAFLARARALTSACDALLICDEVQSGLHRCGQEPFAFQKLGVVPDVVTMAKGIGGGFPLGACAARGSVGAVFGPGDHGSTFGGSNLAMACALATLQTMEKEGLGRNAEQAGAYLRLSLARLPFVTDVRGFGLMVAAELAQGVDAGTLVTQGLDAGLVLNCTGPSTLRFLPPLVCRRTHVDELVAKLGQLPAVQGEGPNGGRIAHAGGVRGAVDQ
ncbi:aminotransferase class III-fold pyridoxal phosphate-dependent enzyme [Berryella wangjianweii]|uniref:Aminotransferase class III-fold pyridoxal phosphate-dependent enzyme n=1 Tax=Berryella wangjianweii TaxID=2734634 RepID=A0A6M8J3I0_9ACTN|nr:aminotransferase class III-fold pyridoxal phosphate-dependent enzyme [Berryella wangjianweii]QKF07711.1 aminotransferase class III-fold pyridoxal phosphate-dependent enzyme [Berryella wangjianweii]